MADHMHWAALLLSAFVAFICDCKPLDGYKFPVYTTESCPRNQTEWSERSSAINCTESNGYLCLPSEELNELLEFCYFEYQIPIAKGLCMFLRKRDSFIDAYNCSNFVEGCPNSTYRIYEVYKYKSCVSIGNRCFLAEPACIRTTGTFHLSTTPYRTASIEETNNTMHEFIPFQERNDWVWILTFLGVGALIIVPVTMFYRKMKSKDGKTRRFDSNCKLNSENNAERNNCTNKQDDSLNLASPMEVDKTLQLLRNKGEDDNLHEENSTYSTCQNGQDNDLQLPLINCTDVNLCSTQGLSPSSVASGDVHESNVQLLIENRANVNLFEKDGKSPLIIACKSGHDNVVGRLIAKGADVNLCNSLGFSPLAVASEHGHASTVQLLVENGSNVNLFEKNGSSPLCMACQGGLDNIVTFLIKNGADVNLCDSLGFSPLAVASYHGHESIVQLLT